MKKLILITILGILVQSCTPKVSSNLAVNSPSPISKSVEIYVIEEGGSVPNNSEFVGNLKIGDTGFSTDCGYEKVILEAKKTARKSGSNFILLTEVKKPNFTSSCYRIKGSMYRNLDESALIKTEEQNIKKNKSRLSENSEYAVVHFYRPKRFFGAALGYKIRLGDDTTIGKARNGQYFKYEIRDFGEYKFWAKTESKSSVVIDVKKGEEYFIRCGLKMGVAVGRPEIYLIENQVGIKEIQEM